jgi:hypothetical protein
MTTPPLAERPTAVYRLFDADDVLLYVGVSWSPPLRLAGHAAEKSWWSEVDRKAVEFFENRAVALWREARAIADESPRYNCVKPNPDRISVPESVSGAPVKLPGLTYEQAAARFNVRPNWLRKGVSAGELHHSCRDTHVWFTEQDMQDIAATHHNPGGHASRADLDKHYWALEAARWHLRRRHCPHRP